MFANETTKSRSRPIRGEATTVGWVEAKYLPPYALMIQAFGFAMRSELGVESPLPENLKPILRVHGSLHLSNSGSGRESNQFLEHGGKNGEADLGESCSADLVPIRSGDSARK